MFAHRRLFFAVAALFVTPFVIGAFLSKEWEAVGRTEAKLDNQTVFAWLESAENWHVWNQAAEETPVDFRVEAVGPARGIGSQVNWSHEQYGRGVLQVVEVDPGRRVRVQITPQGGAPIYSEVILRIASVSPCDLAPRLELVLRHGAPRRLCRLGGRQAGRARVQRSLASLEEQVRKTTEAQSSEI